MGPRQVRRLAIVVWIEQTYHRRRRQTPWPDAAPTEFQTIYSATPTAYEPPTPSVNQTGRSPTCTPAGPGTGQRKTLPADQRLTPATATVAELARVGRATP